MCIILIRSTLTNNNDTLFQDMRNQRNQPLDIVVFQLYKKPWGHFQLQWGLEKNVRYHGNLILHTRDKRNRAKAVASN